MLIKPSRSPFRVLTTTKLHTSLIKVVGSIVSAMPIVVSQDSTGRSGNVQEKFNSSLCQSNDSTQSFSKLVFPTQGHVVLRLATQYQLSCLPTPS